LVAALKIQSQPLIWSFSLLALVVEFRIKPAHIDAFDVAIRANAKASVDTEPGCRQFDVCRDPNDAALFFLYELYDDEAAIQAHLQSPHFLEMNAATATWVDTKVVRTFKRTQP
jgi:(4S)-4-hydroxy-5-phosphonooxypentane-2,3-dione isomerase